LVAGIAEDTDMGDTFSDCEGVLQYFGIGLCENTLEQVAAANRITVETFVGIDATQTVSFFCPVACDTCAGLTNS